jgi:Uma2 family endonuclease
MAAPGLKRTLSHDDYLALEDASDVKHALRAGEIFAMAGGTRVHAALSSAVGGELRTGCGCAVYSSDLRLTPLPGESMYADVTVGCPPAAAPPHDPQALANPVLIAEVLSPSTADTGGKFRLYREFVSLRHYLLVHRGCARDSVAVMRPSRQQPEVAAP